MHVLGSPLQQDSLQHNSLQQGSRPGARTMPGGGGMPGRNPGGGMPGRKPMGGGKPPGGGGREPGGGNPPGGPPGGGKPMGGGMPGRGIPPGGPPGGPPGMPGCGGPAPAGGPAAGGGRMMAAALTCGRGSLWPGAGPPMPRAGPARPCERQSRHDCQRDPSKDDSTRKCARHGGHSMTSSAHIALARFPIRSSICCRSGTQRGCTLAPQAGTTATKK